MKKVLVTGANGFIGKSLVASLSQHHNYAIDADYFSDSKWPEFLIHELDRCAPQVVFHVGACSDTLEQRVNYMMIRNYESTKILVDWCKNNEVPIIYSSSAANYGINGEYPSNLYGWSKCVAEDYVLSNGGLALRYFNVYGPGEAHKGKMASVAYQAHKKYQEAKKPVGLFPGEPQRDFVYVEDIVSANLYAWGNYKNLIGKYYEVGSGEARLFEDIADILGIPYYHYDEREVPKGYQFYTCSDRRKWIPGWVPEYNLETGLIKYKEVLS